MPNLADTVNQLQVIPKTIFYFSEQLNGAEKESVMYGTRRFLVCPLADVYAGYTVGYIAWHSTAKRYTFTSSVTWSFDSAELQEIVEFFGELQAQSMCKIEVGNG